MQLPRLCLRPAAPLMRLRFCSLLWAGLDIMATLGSLADLRAANKGGLDPNGLGASRLATDVMWSDPVMEPGFAVNEVRGGVGMIFGPDVTERFLRENGLRLILRSHEGPDAREGREDMGNMLEGYTLDHDTPGEGGRERVGERAPLKWRFWGSVISCCGRGSYLRYDWLTLSRCLSRRAEGRLMTVFSAPDYPQFIHEQADRYRNKAAVAVLSAPDFGVPRMVQFEADMPRPAAAPYYDLAVPDSDEEFEPAASDLSGMTGVTHDVADSDDAAGGTAQGPGECESTLPAPAAAAAAAAAAEASVDGVAEAVEAAELPPTEAAPPPEEAAEGEAELPRRGRDAKRACRDLPAALAPEADRPAATELVAEAQA